jgi:cell division GTPase FtsZ
MDSIVANALKRTLGSAEEKIGRFRIESTSGATFSNVDYFKLAEQQFGIQVKKAKIVVVGCGGAGSNSVTRLTEMGIQGAYTVALNTDAKALAVAKADKKILIGKELTKGLGCGGYPEDW